MKKQHGQEASLFLTYYLNSEQILTAPSKYTQGPAPSPDLRHYYLHILTSSSLWITAMAKKLSSFLSCLPEEHSH